MKAGLPRRVVAVVLPHLLCEIAEQRMVPQGRDGRTVCLGVVVRVHAPACPAESRSASYGATSTGAERTWLREHRSAGATTLAERTSAGAHRSESGERLRVVEASGSERTSQPRQLGDVLWAVNDVAQRCGVRAGQTVAEARAMAAGLTLVGISSCEIEAALGRIAETLLQFSSLVAIALGEVQGIRDCIWLDITNSVHLWGGEAALLEAIMTRVQVLGHRVRTAISDGPVLARAIALSSPTVETIVPSADTVRTIEPLPIAVLPLAADGVSWLAKLGLWTFGDLRRIPARAALPRLGESAGRILPLVHGYDDAPLDPYRPEETLNESVEWDEPIQAIEPLLFALRRLTARLGARLEGRGEAARVLEFLAPYDPGMARCVGIQEASLSFRIELPAALLHEQDLFRVYKTKIERMVLLAPVTGVSICAGLLVPAPAVQLEMGGDITVSTDPRAMSLLLAELSAQIGKDKIGVLEIARDHKPEAKSLLVTLGPNALARRSVIAEDFFSSSDCPLPSRLLAEPVPVATKPVRGGTMAIGQRIYTIQKLSHPVRFDGLDWWTSHPVHRDYVRVCLGAGNQAIEAWMFTDRITGRTYLHGYYD